MATMQELIDETGAEGYRPWLLLARAHWAESPAESQRWRAEALMAFERIGADGHVARYKAKAA
jgi:hypothetical protein